MSELIYLGKELEAGMPETLREFRKNYFEERGIIKE